MVVGQVVRNIHTGELFTVKGVDYVNVTSHADIRQVVTLEANGKTITANEETMRHFVPVKK